MTDREIIHKLQHIRCFVLPSPNHKQTIDDAVDFIISQQAEIERLKSENIMVVDISLDETEIREQLEKIKTQKKICIDNTESIRAEAIKEFAEKLKEKADVWEDADFYFQYITTNDIDNLVKEMAGADNDK